MPAQVQCTVCSKPIQKRRDLVVAGKSISPFHRSCFSGGQARVTVWTAGPPLNGLSFWVALAALATLWFGLPELLDTLEPRPLHLLLAFVGSALVAMRLLSWITVERHVPRS